MEVTLLPSAPSGRQFLTSYLINGTVAVDAGSLGLMGGPADQARVKHVFLTHTHLDHLATLPLFLDNAYTGTADCVTVHGTAPVLDCLRRDLFNDRLWPDFVRLSEGLPPYLRLHEIRPGIPVEAAGLRVTPVEVNHLVPTVGYVVDDGKAAIAVPSDTGPTEEIWRVAARAPNLSAVFLEATFPDAMAWLADVSRHLTPALLAAEVRKLGRDVRWLAVHLHPRFHEQVASELAALGLAGLEIADPGRPYIFP